MKTYFRWIGPSGPRIIGKLLPIETGDIVGLSPADAECAEEDKENYEKLSKRETLEYLAAIEEEEAAAVREANRLELEIVEAEKPVVVEPVDAEELRQAIFKATGTLPGANTKLVNLQRKWAEIKGTAATQEDTGTEGEGDPNEGAVNTGSTANDGQAQNDPSDLGEDTSENPAEVL